MINEWIHAAVCRLAINRGVAKQPHTEECRKISRMNQGRKDILIFSEQETQLHIN